jgi:putative tryptophan/tyrosine transport system substrate-binding protein
MMRPREGSPMERRGSYLNRRQFVLGTGMTGLGLLAGCGRLPWQAQVAAKVPRIGVLLAVPAAPAGAPSAPRALQEGLSELGYVDGQNIVVDVRYADGRPELLPELAAELVQLSPDVIVTATFSGTRDFARANSRIPFVVVTMGDPIATGLADSLAHPGGNITGTSVFLFELIGKRLELLRDAVTGISRVGVMGLADRGYDEAERAARTLGIGLELLEVARPEDLDRVFATATRERVDAVMVLPGPTLTAYQPQIAAWTAATRLPAMADRSSFVQAGGLMAYGPNLRDSWRRAATYVDKILKGKSPAELPIEQPMTFDFVVNMKTAQALGISFPDEIMLQVTEVIQ